MEPNHGKNSEMPPDTSTAHEALLTSSKRSNSTSSSSSSSSCYSSGRSFDDEDAVHHKAEHSPNGSSPRITSPPDHSLLDMPANQSPPAQVMQRAEESSSYRIPSNVFARNPSTSPVEWSVTSNESLFSIHMGNNSFSGDQIFLMGRSGELGKPGEYNNYLESKAMESKNPYPLSPESEPGQNMGVTEAAAETMKDVIRVTGDQNKVTKPPVETARNSSYSRPSDESGNSMVSFAFPILTGDESRTISAKVDPVVHPMQTQEVNENKVQQSQHQEEQKDKPQEQPPSPAPDTNPSPPPPPAAAQSKWFPCFSCCSFCC